MQVLYALGPRAASYRTLSHRSLQSEYPRSEKDVDQAVPMGDRMSDFPVTYAPVAAPITSMWSSQEPGIMRHERHPRRLPAVNTIGYKLVMFMVKNTCMVDSTIPIHSCEPSPK